MDLLGLDLRGDYQHPCARESLRHLATDIAARHTDVRLSAAMLAPVKTTPGGEVAYVLLTEQNGRCYLIAFREPVGIIPAGTRPLAGVIDLGRGNLRQAVTAYVSDRGWRLLGLQEGLTGSPDQVIFTIKPRPNEVMRQLMATA